MIVYFLQRITELDAVTLNLRKEVSYMRKIASFVFALVLCMGLAVPAAAAMSNQGGNDGGDSVSPKTGSSTVAVLALTACAAGGVGAAAYKKSKE